MASTPPHSDSGRPRSSRPRALGPGAVLAGRWRLQRTLGKGAMGTVYEAVDVQLGGSVAIKLLRRRVGEESTHLERLRREAKAAASIGHPNIAKAHELHSEHDPPFFVMELIQGVPLNRRLVDGPIPVPEAVSIALQMLDALGAAHDAGIVHRDLKPSNVMLTKLGSGETLVRLIDFGIAKMLDVEAVSRLTKTGAFLGTPRWSAPEQVRGARDIDGRADIHAVGALLYTMLSQRPPFDADFPQVLVDVEDRVPLSLHEVTPTVPRALSDVVDWALSKRAEDRPQTAAEMAEALSAALVAPPRTPPSPPAPRMPTSRLLFFVLASVPLLAALVGAVLVGSYALKRAATSNQEPAPASESEPVASPAAPDRRAALPAACEEQERLVCECPLSSVRARCPWIRGRYRSVRRGRRPVPTDCEARAARARAECPAGAEFSPPAPTGPEACDRYYVQACACAEAHRDPALCERARYLRSTVASQGENNAIMSLACRQQTADLPADCRER